MEQISFLFLSHPILPIADWRCYLLHFYTDYRKKWSHDDDETLWESNLDIKEGKKLFCNKYVLAAGEENPVEVINLGFHRELMMKLWERLRDERLCQRLGILSKMPLILQLNNYRNWITFQILKGFYQISELGDFSSLFPFLCF